MASYTDSITQFNPYVEQQPVEAMIKVGMQKQSLYDQGIQKIQSYIDNIGGLDIIKDPHKQYLQSKIDELGNNLTKVSAGDFSNSQLVNSVAGMTQQIVKDPIVQNAVNSTASIRREQQKMADAQKAGKSSPENESWFNYGVNNWLNDENINSSYDGGYTPYRDVTKKWINVQKELGATDYTTELPFLQDSEGHYIDNAGKPLPADSIPVLNKVMIQKIFKGKSPAAIKGAIMSSMDEGDIQQLNITGWYHYKDVPINGLAQMAQVKQQEFTNQSTQYLKALQNMKSLNPDNKQYQADIDQRIGETKNSIISSQQEFQQSLSLIKSNPNTYRSQVYMQHAINDFATHWSNLTETVNYVNNPYQEYIDKERSYKLNVDRFLETTRHDKATEAQADKNFNFEYAKWQESAAEKTKLNHLLNVGSLPQNLINDVIPLSVSSYGTDLQNQKQGIEDNKKDFKTKNFKNMSEEDFGKLYTTNLTAFNHGQSVDPVWQDFLDKNSALEKNYGERSSLLSNIQNQASEKFKNEDTIVKTILDKMKNSDTVKPADNGWLTDNSIFAHKSTVPSKTGTDISGKLNNELGTLMSKKNAWIVSQLAQKDVNWQPTSFSFNIGKPDAKSFITQQFAQVLNRIETQKGKQEENTNIKGWDLSTAKTLNSEGETKYGVIRQGGNAYLNMQGTVKGKDVPVQFMKISSGEYQQLFGEPITSPYQRVSDLIWQNGNTNIESGNEYASIKQNPDAYKTAYFSKKQGGSQLDDFPNVRNYNIKADIIELNSGNYQTYFYVQVPGANKEMQWKAINSGIHSDVTSLVGGISRMTDDDVKLLLK